MPSLGQLIYSLHDEEKKIIRKLEKVNYKKNSCRVAILFNEIMIIVIIMKKEIPIIKTVIRKQS